MKKSILLIVLSLTISVMTAQQNQVQTDSTKTQTLDEVLVQSVRVKPNAPITHSDVTKAQLEPRNLGQDLPILLNYLPSVVTTTDAGNGVGYTYMRVRGSDGSRINVTLNGIPFNDSESQGTFFVNLPDFASSLENIQLQRGVGTSTSGAGAFGARLIKKFNKAYWTMTPEECEEILKILDACKLYEQRQDMDGLGGCVMMSLYDTLKLEGIKVN